MIMAALFSLTYLVYQDAVDPYVEVAKAIVRNRYHLLFKTLGFLGLFRG